MKKCEIRLDGKSITDWISERNLKFECEDCGKEIYGKKVKFRVGVSYESWCLKCFVKYYDGRINNLNNQKENKEDIHIKVKKIKERNKRIREEEDIIIRIRNEVKEKYAVDLVALEL